MEFESALAAMRRHVLGADDQSWGYAMSRTMKDIEAMGNASGRQSGGPKLEPGAQKALGRELRAMYDELVEEPVPDRFLRLLDQLEQASVPAAKDKDDTDRSG